MSEEQKPRKLSIIETMTRIGNLRVMKQREADEQSDAHKTAEALERLAQGQTATRAAAESAAAAGAWLVADRKGKIKKHQEQGKINQEKADTAEAKRAARDIETALERVNDRMTRGETNLNAVCNWVILHFTPIGRKDEYGRHEQYAPLMSAKGKPMQYETLAKYYRKKYGTKREHKANAAKNQARTQAARNAKAARSKSKK